MTTRRHAKHSLVVGSDQLRAVATYRTSAGRLRLLVHAQGDLGTVSARRNSPLYDTRYRLPVVEWHGMVRREAALRQVGGHSLRTFSGNGRRYAVAPGREQRVEVQR